MQPRRRRGPNVRRAWFFLSCSNQTSPSDLGFTTFSRTAVAKSSRHLSLVYFWEPKFEAVEKDLLMIGPCLEAAFADVDAAVSWYHNVRYAEATYFFQDATRLIAKPCQLAHFAACLRQSVCQESDEEASQDTVFFRVPNRADLQVSIVNTKDCLRLGQLDVRFLQHVVAPVHDVGAKKVTAGAACGPVARRFDFILFDTSVAVFGFLDGTLNRLAARVFYLSRRPSLHSTFIGSRSCFHSVRSSSRASVPPFDRIVAPSLLPSLINRDCGMR